MAVFIYVSLILYLVHYSRTYLFILYLLIIFNQHDIPAWRHKTSSRNFGDFDKLREQKKNQVQHNKWVGIMGRKQTKAGLAEETRYHFRTG